MSKERAGGKGIQRRGPGSQGGQYKRPRPPNVGFFFASHTLELKGSFLSQRHTARFVYAPSHARLFTQYPPHYAPDYTGGLGRSTETYSNNVNIFRMTLHPSRQWQCIEHWPHIVHSQLRLGRPTQTRHLGVDVLSVVLNIVLPQLCLGRPTQTQHLGVGVLSMASHCPAPTKFGLRCWRTEHGPLTVVPQLSLGHST